MILDKSNKYDKGKVALTIIWTLLFTTFIMIANMPKDVSETQYSWYKLSILDEYIEIIRNGSVPPFLSINGHSWGYGLYLPYLAHALNIDESWKILAYLNLTFSWFAIIFVTYKIYKITKNLFLTSIAPVLLHIFVGNYLYGYNSDTFWPAGWALVITFPLIYDFIKANSIKKELYYICFIGGGCSVSNIVRNHNGITVLAVVVLICILRAVKRLRDGNIKGTFASVFEIVIFYLCYGLFDKYLPLFIGTIMGQKVLNNTGFFWHSILCGLGVYDNKYGLAWSDDTIRGIVGSIYTNVPTDEFYSNEYFEACKAYFFDIFTRDPGFVISTWMNKFGKTLINVMQIEFTNVKDLYLSQGIINVHNLLIPTLITAGGLVYCNARKLFSINEKRLLITLVLISFIEMLVGTIQSLIGYVDTRYFQTALVGMGFTIFLVAIFCCSRIKVIEGKINVVHNGGANDAL